MGALCYSLYIFRISAFGRKGLPGDLTQAWKTVLLAVMYVGWAAADWFKWMKAPALVAAPWAGWANPLAWATLAFTAVVCGFLSDILQARGQESVSPSESQVLLAGEREQVPDWSVLQGGSADKKKVEEGPVESKKITLKKKADKKSQFKAD